MLAHSVAIVTTFFPLQASCRRATATSSWGSSSRTGTGLHGIVAEKHGTTRGSDPGENGAAGAREAGRIRSEVIAALISAWVYYGKAVYLRSHPGLPTCRLGFITKRVGGFKEFLVRVLSPVLNFLCLIFMAHVG